MDSHTLWTALALVLIIEGLFPFASSSMEAGFLEYPEHGRWSGAIYRIELYRGRYVAAVVVALASQ